MTTGTQLMACDAQASMSFQTVLGVLVEGVKSNFWGLACPSYCTQPSFGLLSFCLLLGWISGLVTACLVFCWVLGFSPRLDFSWARAPDFSQPSRSNLLASYLHASNHQQSRRRSWASHQFAWESAGLHCCSFRFCWTCCWLVGLHLSVSARTVVCCVWQVFWACVSSWWTWAWGACTCSTAWDPWLHPAIVCSLSQSLVCAFN